jgi:2-hydroxy-6-oxonona-2,4-dienedioate hydrolase
VKPLYVFIDLNSNITDFFPHFTTFYHIVDKFSHFSYKSAKNTSVFSFQDWSKRSYYYLNEMPIFANLGYKEVMTDPIIIDGKYKYVSLGEGAPIVILHGLMGGLSNFKGVMEYFPSKGYRVIVPELPIYDMPILKTTVKSFASYVDGFLKHLKLTDVILVGNSLGGHIALLETKTNPSLVKALVITGSSGLYESAMGDGYPKRGDYEFIKKKAEEVFYNPTVATKEIVDEVFATVNNRLKLIKTLAIAKSAIRHNMSKDLPKMKNPTCIIWGRNDGVTPPNVADEFNALLPNSDLFWIDKCGHAPMMEHPDTFNTILEEWLVAKGF